MLSFILYLLLYMFFIGDVKAKLDAPLNDPAFQVVWGHLEKKRYTKTICSECIYEFRNKSSP